MAETYIVNEVVRSEDWEGQYGPMVSYYLDLQGEEGLVSVNQKPETAPPKSGDELMLEITSTPRGKRGKKVNPKFAGGGGGARNGSGGGGGGGRSPHENRRIVRQHSQEMALRLLAIGGVTFNAASDTEVLAVMDTVKKLTNQFDADVMAVTDPSGGPG